MSCIPVLTFCVLPTCFIMHREQRKLEHVNIVSYRIGVGVSVLAYSVSFSMAVVCCVCVLFKVMLSCCLLSCLLKTDNIH